MISPRSEIIFNHKCVMFTIPRHDSKWNVLAAAAADTSHLLTAMSGFHSKKYLIKEIILLDCIWEYC